MNFYLQALGMLYADASVSLFEGSPELMEIPKLPITMDTQKFVNDNLNFFRKNAVGYKLTSQCREVEDVPAGILLKSENEVTLNIWGDVIWTRWKKVIFGRKILDPLSKKLDLSLVKKSLEIGSCKEHLYEINDALDNFSAYLEKYKKILPESNKFKQLQGRCQNGHKIHELYIWNGPSAGRLIGYFDEKNHNTFVAIDAGPHP